jgi:hypothetical protein
VDADKTDTPIKIMWEPRVVHISSAGCITSPAATQPKAISNGQIVLTTSSRNYFRCFWFYEHKKDYCVYA